MSHSSKIHGYSPTKGHHHSEGGEDGEHHKSDHAFSLPGDMNAVAMMPQEVVYRSVSEPYANLPEAYEDTPAGVDEQIRYDNSQLRKAFKPTKV